MVFLLFLLRRLKGTQTTRRYEYPDLLRPTSRIFSQSEMA